MFRKGHGKLIVKPRRAGSVAHMAHLYSFVRRTGDLDVALERDFLGPQVDAPAALIHQQLIDGRPVTDLSGTQKVEWARFLVSLLVRGPEMIHHLRDLGRTELIASLEKNPAEYEAAKGSAEELTFVEYLNTRNPTLFENFGIQMLPEVLQREQFLGPLLAGKTWFVRSLHDADHTLLLGDRPMLQEGPLNMNHVFVLPIAPRLLFGIASSGAVAHAVLRRSPNQVARRVNSMTVKRAQTYVFGADDSERAIVAKHLAEPATSHETQTTPRATKPR